MLKKLFYFNRKRFFIFLATAIILTVLIPFGVIVFLPVIIDLPLLYLYPGMSEGGELVTYWYAGVVPKTGYAWLVFIVYHSFVSFIISWYYVLDR